MTALLFLGLGAAVFALVMGVTVLRHRERRSSIESGIEKFRREMSILAPDDPDRTRRGRDR